VNNQNYESYVVTP